MLPTKTLTPADFLAIARRRIWLVTIPPAVLFFGALLYSSTIPNRYQSDMLIAIIPQRVPDSIVRTTVTLRADERMDEIATMVSSRTNLEQMISEMGLYKDELEKYSMSEVVTMMRGSLEVGLEPQRRGPRGPEPPHAFHIRFTYSDPNVAAKVTQRIGAVFVEQNTKGRGLLAEQTNDFLEDELADARRRLEEQERRLELFRERHGKELPTQAESNMEAARGLQLQVQSLVESIARDRDRKLMLERLYREAQNDQPVSSMAGRMPAADPSVPATGSTLQQQLRSEQASLTALLSRYTQDHPDVRRAKSRIADLEKRIDAEAAEPATAAAATRAEPVDPAEQQRRENLRQMLAEIESLDRQTSFKESEERRLRSEIADYQRRVEAVPGIESEWVKLSRDYETIQDTYKELLRKAEAAKVAVNLEERQIGEQFRILDEAQVPVNPVTSIRAAINAGGLVVGLLLGLGVAALLEFRDQSFRSDSDVLSALTLPVLAVVPRIVDAAEAARMRTRRMVYSAIGVVCVVGAGYLTWALELWKSLI
ncbi:MAG: GNVR domain-containing protein [Vicinamibacterales bacterium]